jgi:hypothetical protein
MSPVFTKLNLKGQPEILIINAPPSFETELATLKGVKIRRDPSVMKTLPFTLAFVSKQAELDRLSKLIAAKAAGDALVWFAYPKATSQLYKCEFNRDSGWDVICTAGFRKVRLVAIDADWSALRFRREEYGKPPARGTTRKAVSGRGKRAS